MLKNKPDWMKNGLSIIMISILTLTILSTSLFAQDEGEGSKLSRYAVIDINNISVEKAKEYLKQINITNVSALPKPGTILITADPEELLKAKSLISVIDSEGNYQFKKVTGVLEREDEVPSSEQMREYFDEIKFGTFYEAPASNGQRAIIDRFGEDIIIAAPGAWVDQIAERVVKLVNEKSDMAAKPEQRGGAETEVEVDVSKEVTFDDEAEEISGGMRPEAEDDGMAEPNKVNGELELLLKELQEAQKELKQQAEKVEESEVEEVEVEVEKSVEKDGMEKKKEIEAEIAAEPEERYKIVEREKGRVVTPLWEIEEVKPKLKRGVIQFGPNEPSYAKEVRMYEPELEVEGGTLDLELPPRLKIEDLLTLVGEYLNLDYMYDPVKVQGEVALNLRGPIKVRDLYPLLESVLKFKGFVMTRKGNLVTIVPEEEVLEIDPTLITDSEELQVGDVLVTKVFRLEHVDTNAAADLLNAMQVGVRITEVAETQTLIVTEYAYRMSRVEELLQLIDKPGKSKQFRYRQLQYTMAQNMVPKLENLAKNLEDIEITIGEIEEEDEQQRRPTRRTARGPRTRPQPTQAGQAEAATGVFLDFDERTNMVLMIGLEEDLEIVEELIDTLDVEQLDLRVLRAYEIQNVGAEDVRKNLIELGVISGRVEEDERASAARRRSPQQRGRPQPEESPAVGRVDEETPLTEEPDVVVIESTNSLLVNATPEQHAQIEIIVSYVDSQALEESIPYVVYPLENQDPEELAAILNDLIAESITMEEADADQKIVRTTTRQKRTEEDIVIVPDPETYSLIVYASKQNQVWLASLIEQLDEYRPQVLLDVTLVEITKDDLFKSDIDWLTKSYSGDNGVFDGLLGQDFSNTRLMDGKAGAGGTDEDPEYLQIFLNSSKTQLLLDLVKRESYGRIMARPKLLVNDNQEGEIKTQNTIPVAQVSTETIIPDQGAPVTNQDVQFVEYESGVTLTIKPHISKGDMLRLEIALNRTDFSLNDPVFIGAEGSLEQFPSPPDRLSTDITTVGTVPDGQTIILGGLESLDQDKGHSKVPILGDIPLIGGLFRTINNSDNQSRLYVFVRASIIRPGDQLEGLEDIKEVSLKNRNEFEKWEGRFQGMDEWPGVDPEAMDPINVLEKDFKEDI